MVKTLGSTKHVSAPNFGFDDSIALVFLLTSSPLPYSVLRVVAPQGSVLGLHVYFPHKFSHQVGFKYHLYASGTQTCNPDFSYSLNSTGPICLYGNLDV